MPDDSIVLVLTRSQLMALIDIVANYLTLPDHTEVFIDASNEVETTPEDIFRLLMQQ